MGKIRFSPGLVTVVAVALLSGLAFFLRAYLPHDWVFAGDQVKFVGADAHYHMRLVDSLVRNFPTYITFDPYLYYPYGSTWPYMPFFDWLIAGSALLVGLGSPTLHTIEAVGAYLPAILGALTVIPVYFIGRELFGRRAGLLAAALIAILPGEFMGRSVLGATDHHAAEVLFSTVAMMFFIMALKSARHKRLSLTDLRNLNWAGIRRPLTFSLLAGVFLGVYLLTWIGGPLFIFIIFAYLVVQTIIDHLRGSATDDLLIVGVVTMLVALLILLPFSPGTLLLMSIVIALVTPLVLNGVSRLFSLRSIRPAYYPLAVLGLGVVGFVVLHFTNPSFVTSVLSRLSIFSPSGVGLTISEVKPLLSVGDSFSFSLAWEVFTTGFFISFISLGMLVYLLVRRGEAHNTILVLWSVMMLAAALGERRFAYYYAINVALLAGYFSSWFLGWVDIRKWVAGEGRPGKTTGTVSLAASRIASGIGMLVVLFVVFVPNTGVPPAWNGPTTNVIEEARLLTPSDAWYSSLSWLRDNTPDPFGDPDFYYELYEAPLPGKAYDYPESAYGVMAWWDYGHWITRIARRLPNHGPGGNWSYPVALCFTAQEEAPANEIIDKLDSRYVVIDYDTATGKFHAMATFAGISPDDFRGIYYMEEDGKLLPIIFFYPEYFRSLSSRLYNFDGKAVVPDSTMVISFEDDVDRAGTAYKRVTSARSFPGYEEAEVYLSGQDAGKYRIVSPDPMVSPVPLAALERYRLVYSSEELTEHLERNWIPTVKIFEYTSEADQIVRMETDD
ncbi:MAG: oligosaccharyl transferase, archaeosortase A system-associated [Dehalococcoidales bacterium]|nr:oligosaccharyl transferase, archaeosortase A system-associated [Dehalococcoidales bacterium]